MPNVKVDCPYCQEKPFESRLGSHLLGKHYRQLLPDDIKELLTARLNKLDAGDTSYLTRRLNTFRIKDYSLQICLVCKKSYGKEKGNDHYKNHPTCADGAKEALRLFLNPPVKKVRIKKEVETVDTKEVETLKKQILKLEKEIKRADETSGYIMDENDKHIKLVQKLFGSENIEYIEDFIAEKEGDGKFKSYKDLLAEQNLKGE